MTTLSMPSSPGFVRSRFGLRANTQSFTSPLDGSVQTLELTGARWFATYSLPAMLRAQAAAWQAFLVQCAGQAGRFYGFDPDCKTPRGAAGGTPLVNGASQTGRTLVTDGWTHGVTGILKAGDYFQVGTELHMVVADANSDGSGNATLTIEPPLRTSPADNAALTTSNPKCVMMLVDDSQAAWDADILTFSGLTFSGIEVFS